jgi:hypothetical protein
MKGLSRQALAGASRTVLSRGSRFKPEVVRIELAAGPAVLKDCSHLPFWSRWLGRWLLHREAGLMERLAGLDGFPPVLARLDADAVLIGMLQGRPLDGEAFARAPQVWSAALRERVRQMHGRGVFHLDLRQPQNLLIDEDRGLLAVVDFGAGHAPGSLTGVMLRPLLGWVDRQAVLKYLARFAPQEMNRAEAEAYLRGQFWRRVWIFSPHRNRGAVAAVRRRLQDLSAASK